MATTAESSPSPPDEKPPSEHTMAATKSTALDDATPWIEYAVQQALLYQKIIQENVDSAIEASRSRISEIGSTGSAHLQYTIGSLQDLKSEYDAMENVLFGKMKEGILIAASNPLITCGVATGLGLIVMKGPRRYLYYKALRLFSSEESLLSRADTKVKELRHSIELLKAESEKLEKRASLAEEQLIRGRTKLKQTGKQIQGVIRSAYKIERQAEGLKDILGELPRREASLFRSQVSSLAKETKREKNALTKKVSKISNYGISV